MDFHVAHELRSKGCLRKVSLPDVCGESDPGRSRPRTAKMLKHVPASTLKWPSRSDCHRLLAFQLIFHAAHDVLRFTFDLIGFSFVLKLFVAQDLADPFLDLATYSLCRTFGAVGIDFIFAAHRFLLECGHRPTCPERLFAYDRSSRPRGLR